MDLKSTIQMARNGLVKNAPSILTGLSVVGVISTTVLGVRATPKAVYILDELLDKKLDENMNEYAEFTPKEIFLSCWKLYIPTAISGALTIASIIAANKINLNRTAVLSVLYAGSESFIKEYQEEVIKSLGAKKEEAVRDEIARKRIEKNPPNDKEVIITGHGETLVYDSLSGRYFKSDIEKIRKIQNDFNRDIINDGYKTLNEFYDELGLDHIRLGDAMGWNTDYGLMDIRFSSMLAQGSTPCLVLDYRIGPRGL